jgi:hypothetical protein
VAEVVDESEECTAGVGVEGEVADEGEVEVTGEGEVEGIAVVELEGALAVVADTAVDGAFVGEGAAVGEGLLKLAVEGSVDFADLEGAVEVEGEVAGAVEGEGNFNAGVVTVVGRLTAGYPERGCGCRLGKAGTDWL